MGRQSPRGDVFLILMRGTVGRIPAQYWPGADNGDNGAGLGLGARGVG